MTTDEKLDLILHRLEQLEAKMSEQNSTPRSFQPGGVDWLITKTQSERREYNRKVGRERRKRK